jgi:hypothetical protein
MSYGAEKKAWNPFSVDLWIAWIAATGVGVAGITTFFYVNFETKDSFADYKQSRLQSEEELIKRLDRIEDKLDQLLSKRP